MLITINWLVISTYPHKLHVKKVDFLYLTDIQRVSNMRIKKLAHLLLVSGTLLPLLSHAVTNGDELFAAGTENTALGGTGVAHYVGAESAFANPSLLGKSIGSQINVGVELFKPNVTNTGFTGNVPATSSANTFYVPDASFSSRINNNWSYGIGMAGIAGMGVNYTGASTQSYVAAKTALSILKILPTIAYNGQNFGIGISPVIQYGTLAISYSASGQAPFNPSNNSNAATGYGVNVGGYYDIIPAVTVAAAYDSQISTSYGSQLSQAGAGFGQTFGNGLNQPAQIKGGVSYSATDRITLTADYKLIQWGDATGYKEFGWKNQNVYAVGAKYSDQSYWLGLGYNNGNNPIGTFANGVPANTTNGQNGIGNLFNNLLFPAIVTNSYTFGGGYSLTQNVELSGAYVYSPKVTTTVDISDAIQQSPGSLYNTSTHSQQAFSLSLRYKFG